MKAIKIGNRYEIYDNSLKVFDSIPAKTYMIGFNKMTGFYLEEHCDMDINEKVYGVHLQKVDKVLAAYDQFQRSLGVILSGDKGIGKSLFAKLLCARAVGSGLPVIIVNRFVPGIASYIESIEQNAVFLFDEFDKTFGSIKTGENEADPQAGLLSLFDGIAQGKKLFVITCNDLYNLNSFLVNRPGRFHYHFRFDYPSAEEITEYLRDKLDEAYYPEITKVISFSKRVNLNYDCLRSIAFELNNGDRFEDAIKDLNIVNTKNEAYNIVLRFDNGETMTARNVGIDLFDPEYEVYTDLDDKLGRSIISVEFNASDCVYDTMRGVMAVNIDDVGIKYDDHYYSKEEVDEVKKLKPESLTISRVKSRDIHYLV